MGERVRKTDAVVFWTGRIHSQLTYALYGFFQKYGTYSEYDYGQLQIGAARYDQLGDWRMRFGGAWDDTS